MSRCVFVLSRFSSRPIIIPALSTLTRDGASRSTAQLVVRSDFAGSSRLSATSPRSSSSSVNAGRRKDSSLDLETGKGISQGDLRLVHGIYMECWSVAYSNMTIDINTLGGIRRTLLCNIHTSQLYGCKMKKD